MTESVRCPSCRGAKKVPKLGGMIGECNTCSGKGTILAADKPVSAAPSVMPFEPEIIKAVSDCVPASVIPKVETPPVSVDIKAPVAKTNIYRKTKA